MGRRVIRLNMRPILLMIPIAFAAQAQTFDVASIRQIREVQAGGYGSEKIVVNPGSVMMHNVRFRAAIRWAYDLKEYQVSAPAWMGSPGYQGRDLARFEIAAKASEGTRAGELRRMMQALLAERFHVALHRETKEIQVFVLSTGKVKPGLKPADDSTSESSASGHDASFTMHHTSLAEFAEFLAGPLHTPVLDRTNRPGRFEITIDLTRYSASNLEPALLPHAIEDQLGLKLERQKLPVEFLVVEHADQKPAEN
jgi:uncharacterized protein (TIGR03435 family)